MDDRDGTRFAVAAAANLIRTPGIYPLGQGTPVYCSGFVPSSMTFEQTCMA
jgi:hypothetical protein